MLEKKTRNHAYACRKLESWVLFKHGVIFCYSSIEALWSHHLVHLLSDSVHFSESCLMDLGWRSVQRQVPLETCTVVVSTWRETPYSIGTSSVHWVILRNDSSHNFVVMSTHQFMGIPIKQEKIFKSEFWLTAKWISLWD